MATGEDRSKWGATIQGDSANMADSFEVQLSYTGKKSPERILDHPASPAELVWHGTPTCSNPNLLYYGDNLDLLASLLRHTQLQSQIKLIYIDPPFATQKIFKSRTRNNAYHDLLTGAHYLEFMRERLVFLRELLAQDGSIYVHLDDNMVFHIKLIMDELFGRSNFRSFITRRKCNPKNYTRRQYGNVSDYILFYTKSNQYIWNRPHHEWTDEHSHQEYLYVEKHTGRRYKKVPLHAPGERNGMTGQAWRGMLPPLGKHWQYTPETLEQMDQRGEIYWSSNGNPRRKIYLDESQGIPIQDIWLDVKDAHNQNIKVTGYPTEKPTELLRRIIQASSQEGDLVLDCFAGSGTTLTVASELNRSWIGMDNSLEALKTILKRFAFGLEAMGDFTHKTSPDTNQPSLPMFDKHQGIRNFELHTFPCLVSELQPLLPLLD